MSERCEPPEGTAQDCLCWIEIDGKVTTARWDAEDRIWTPERGTSFTATSPFAVKNRVRYLAPVPSPEAVRALVVAARRLRDEAHAVAEDALDADEESPAGIRLHVAIVYIETALTPFQEPAP